MLILIIFDNWENAQHEANHGKAEHSHPNAIFDS